MNFKWLRGASLFVPILVAILSVALYFLVRRSTPDDPIAPDWIPIVALLAIALFVQTIALLFFVVFDIIQVAKRHSFSAGAKAGWICGLVLLSVIAVPAYGWLYFKEAQ